MSFEQETIDAVWEKATTVYGYDKNDVRKDQCDAWIKKSKYGNRNSKYGWEIDHIKAKTNDGGDELSNLRPLHWKNNASRGSSRLNTQNPAVKSDGNKNVQLNDDDEYENM